MTDLELLKLAAKACRWTSHTWSEEYYSGGPDGDGFVRGLIVRGYGVWSGVPWNPLTDDGDALRLAVGLRIDVVQFDSSVRADSPGADDCHESHDSDPYAATRRAIVRAAAEIGRSQASTNQGSLQGLPDA
jgi:hypothetical protein